MKQLLLSFLFTLLMSIVGIKSFAQDFAIANSDGVTIYYVWTNNNTELAVTYSGSSNSYSSNYSGIVVIPESVECDGFSYKVTSIGDRAFYNCSSLTSIKIPNSVTSIGREAFDGCSCLSSIDISNSVNSIGYSAFGCCTSLKSLTIPNSLTSINNSSFAGCSGLTSIEIPNSVTSIGAMAFSDCSGLTSIEIPNSVTTIGEVAFSGCSGLISIEIPNSVTNIGEMAFSGCSSLYSVMYKSNAKSIGSDIFEGCNSIKEITFDCETVTSIFSSISSIDKINLSNNVKTINQGAFSGCKRLKSIEIPNSVTSIGDYAFNYCICLTSIELPNSLTSIGQYTFSDCSGLTSIKIPNSVISIGDKAFYNCSSLTSIEIPNSVTNIGDKAFYNCSSLTSIEIPNSVTNIGKMAFSNCSSLYSVTYKCNTTLIGSDIFEGCNSIKEVTFDCETVTSLFSSVSLIDRINLSNNVKTISQGAFLNYRGLTSVTIPNSVTSIGDKAFSGCRNLISLVIGSGVTSIGGDAFYGTNLKNTIWLTNTPPSGYSNASGTINYVSNDKFTSLKNTVKYQFLSSYFDVDGVRYVPVVPSERTCDAIDCVYDESATELIISSKVVYKGVTMNVKNIKPYLAYNNTFIKTLSVDNDGILDNYAFTNCSNINMVTLGKKVSAIGSHAFQGCSSIETIDIPDIVTALNDYTFADCTSLKVIKIMPKMTDIKNSVFNNCTSLAKVIIADSDTELNLGSNKKGSYDYGNPLFSSCPLNTVYIGRNINYNKTSSYGYSPFYRNTSLRSVEITDKETEISDNEFYGCTNLQRVTIGDGITTIGNFAFSGCQSLQYFAFGSQVATIGQEAFSDCAAVTEIISKATTPPVCGSQALDDINKWECKLYVPDGCMAAYTSADQWKDFFFAEEGTGTAEQNPDGQPTTGKCEKPTISLVDGKIHFACATEGVSYTYHVTATNPSGVGNDINPSTLKLTVYASKPGFETSDAATIEFAAPSGLKGDLNEDGTVNVADHVELTKIIMDQE